MDILDRLHKQLDIMDSHKDFNESCTVIDLIDAIKEIGSLRVQLSKPQPTSQDVEIQRLINIYNNWDKNVKVDLIMSTLRAK